MTYYQEQPDRIAYRVKLRQLSERRHTRGDLVFANIRRRIALAALVRRTPGWSWRDRARVFGGNPIHLADMWRKQNSGQARDCDACDRNRR